MRSNVFKDARVSLYILACVMAFSLLFYVFASMFTSVGYRGFRRAREANTVVFCNKPTVILDAGHGGEDPGAVDNGLIEKDLNLSVTLKLDEILRCFGYNTALTRNDDVLLYNEGEEERKKYHDVRNRASFAEGFEDAIFISIHMNKFSAEYCKGLQTFYSNNNPQSKVLAEYVQENSRTLQNYNKRVIKSGDDTIYLLDNLNMPAILIECGFISNLDEALLLSDDDYQVALAFTLYCGISEFLESI